MPTVKELITQLGPWPASKDEYTQKECDVWQKSFALVEQTVAGQAYVNAGKAVDEVENKLRHARLDQHKATLVVTELEKALEIAKHVEAALGAVEVS